ncbi:MAG: response regulator transcription factor [Firmicutes bacterium]|nr:response regulator transcription factor [Bacillota bacterium]
MQRLIYLAEDDDTIRELIVYAASSEGYDIKAFSNADLLLRECEKQMPDLILLDIMMPGTDGITALKKIREREQGGEPHIILLTAKVTEINRIKGLDAGADDYITKPFSVLELMARIRASLRKKDKSSGVGIKSGKLEVNDIVLCLDTRSVSVSGRLVPLTLKEFELLKFLMQSVGVVVEREVIFKKVWGDEYFGETRTVDIHMKNLRGKLGEASSAIQSIRGVGYILLRNNE